MPRIVGIDLGTTFSAIATLDHFGQPSITHNQEGENVTPSCIEFFEDGRADVGKYARNNLGNPLLYAIGKFKRFMGEEVMPVGGDNRNIWSTYEALNLIRKELGKELTPTALSALVLKKLRTDAEEEYGDDIVEAVVTIPASFSHEARLATMAAARDSGLNVNYIINEPTAAALYFSHKQERINGTYAVYDLGGGTFDISIIHINGNEVESLATNGVLDLGGDDFDRALLGVVNEKYVAEFGEDPPKGAGSFGLLEAEELKKALSNKDSVNAIINGRVIPISRQEFEESISTYIAKAEMLSQASLDDANLSREDLEGVILAGGSTRIPKVLQSIEEIFGQAPLKTNNPDEIVALGAALYASIKGDQSVLTPLQKDAIGNLEVQEITAECYGTFHLKNDEMTKEIIRQNTVLIPARTQIPHEVSKMFETWFDGQDTLRCSVTISTELQTDPRFVRVVREGELGLPPNRPAGRPIQVTFSYDANQIMHCVFEDIDTGRVTTFDLEMAGDGGESEEPAFDIDNFLLE